MAISAKKVKAVTEKLRAEAAMAVTGNKVHLVAEELRVVMAKLQELIDSKKKALDNAESRENSSDDSIEKLSRQVDVLVLQEAFDDMETTAEGLEFYENNFCRGGQWNMDHTESTCGVDQMARSHKSNPGVIVCGKCKEPCAIVHDISLSACCLAGIERRPANEKH